jgi:hypothetical protein
MGAESYPAEAVAIHGMDRDRLYAEIASRLPTFAGYQGRTDRVIPLFELRRVPGNQS